MVSMQRLLVTTSVLLALASWSCTWNRAQAREPSDLEGEEGEVTVEALWDEEPRNVIEIPDLLNPYEDDFGTCACCCAAQCGVAHDTSEFEDFVVGMKEEATAKAVAAAEALLDAGPDLVKHDGWKEMARDAMEILANPILVVVQLPSGKWQKVSFEALPDLDLELGIPDNACPVPIARGTVSNVGALAASDIVVRIYAGNPEAGGVPLAEVVLPGPLEPGQSEDFEVELTSFPVDQHIRLYAIADPDDAIAECNNANNKDGPTDELYCAYVPE